MSEKWWDMSDDELDDLFRDASDKVDVPFESSSFDKLRQKIDIQRKPELPQRYKSRWLVLLAGLFLIVGVGLVYHSVNKRQSLVIDSKGDNSTEIIGNIEQKNTMQPSNPSSSVSSETSPKEEIQKESHSLKHENLPNNLANLSKQKERVIEKLNPLLSVSPRTAQPLSVETQTKAEGNAEKNVHTRTESNVELSEKDGHTKTKENSVITNSSPANTTLANNQPINKSQKKENIRIYNADNQVVFAKNSKNSKVKKGKHNASNPMILAQNTSLIIENSIIIPEKIASEKMVDRTNFYGVNDLKNKEYKSPLSEIPTDLPPYIDSLPKISKSPKLRHFGIRVALSPDINSIENLDYSALGGSVGLLFEYRISKKLALQTGVSYSSKKYVGDFEYYHAWPDWTKGHPSKPTEVDGKCKVIDIPINLRVNIFQKPHQTWFVSAGVSSYILLNETYIYNYAWSPAKTSDWSDKSSFYWSTLNLSIGWEKQVSKHLSFQAEPYLKTPLKGVGRGLVNLYSSGILFSTKYQF